MRGPYSGWRVASRRSRRCFSPFSSVGLLLAWADRSPERGRALSIWCRVSSTTPPHGRPNRHWCRQRRSRRWHQLPAPHGAAESLERQKVRDASASGELAMSKLYLLEAGRSWPWAAIAAWGENGGQERAIGNFHPAASKCVFPGSRPRWFPTSSRRLSVWLNCASRSAKAMLFLDNRSLASGRSARRRRRFWLTSSTTAAGMAD